MLKPGRLRYLMLILIWSGGIFLAIASKSYDPEEEETLPPVIVDFVVTIVDDFLLEDGTTDDTVTNGIISGSFSKAANDRITLRNVPVTLDTSTMFSIAVVPNDPVDLLSGTADINVSQTLEFGFNRVPEQGQISTDFEGTTTLVTFDGNANNVVLETGGQDAQTISFTDLRTDFADENIDLDRRMASKSYRNLELLWQLTTISETIHQEIESQQDALGSAGIQSNLELDCDNSNGTPDPVYVLRWEQDAAGTGQGEAGNNDNFSVTWTNCRLNSEDRYLDDQLEINNYQLTNDIAPRSMSYLAIFRTLFVATEEIPVAAVPLTDRERSDGSLIINVAEQTSTP